MKNIRILHFIPKSISLHINQILKTMRNFIFTSLFACLTMYCINSHSQPTLTASGVSATVGETFSYNSFSTQLSSGNAGANQTWNLASMSGTTSGITTVVTASSTPNGSQFPNANIAYSTPGAGTTYMNMTSSAWQYYGVVPASGTPVIAYSNPEDMLRFPFTFNNTYTDTWAAQFTSGYTFYRTGTTTVTADGYGTLITPNGTYTNVLRIHFYQSYKDSAFFGTPYIINYTNDQYIWYKEGYHTYLASVYSTTNSVGQPSYGGSYPSQGTGIHTLPDFLTGLSLFPNPASDFINLEFELSNEGLLEIGLFDLSGRQTKVKMNTVATIGSNQIQMNVSGLSKGIYYLSMVLDGIQIASHPVSIAE